MTEIVKDTMRDYVSDLFLYSSTITQSGRANLVTPMFCLISQAPRAALNQYSIAKEELTPNPHIWMKNN